MRHDPAFDVLLPFLQSCSGKTLWLADENVLSWVSAVYPSENLVILSNRFDVVCAARSAGHVSVFSDFDCSAYPSDSFARIVYRVSKEKALVHYSINQAARLLSVGGELVLAGLKTEGSKTYLEKCSRLFGNGRALKNGTVYSGCFVKQVDGVCAAPLDDQDYARLRWLEAGALGFYSKPGVFGWDRIDEGSAFLLAALGEDFVQRTVPQSMLDLGCGYGYLTVMTRHWPLARRVAVDNNAAALRAMEANAAHYQLAVDVVADDVARTLRESFDVILCNPPFHRGFAVAEDLTDQFLTQAARLLASNGVAVFVVNGFIPLEQKAAAYFSSVKTLASNRSFKVVALSQ